MHKKILSIIQLREIFGTGHVLYYNHKRERKGDNKMTYRERFEAAMMRRGYEVSRLGLMTILRHDNYTAYHFFTAAGERNTAEKPMWFLG